MVLQQVIIPKALLYFFALLFAFANSQSSDLLASSQRIERVMSTPKRAVQRLHKKASQLQLLSEPGYHWCPEWADGGWCPEGYLCGDGNNGCDYGHCCDDDANVLVCENHSSNGDSDFTPCGGNAANPSTGEYHCCDISQICGDGTQCTNRCPAGSCCEFDPSDVPQSCGYHRDVDEEECPGEVSNECCMAPSGWDLDDNRMVDEAYADYYKSNDDCWEGNYYEIGEDRVIIDCNFALGSYEYVCQHEGGAICSLTLDVTMESEEVGADPLAIDFTFYHCIAMECDNDADEDEIEHYLEELYFNFADYDLTVDCDSLHCECDASEKGGAQSDRCDGAGRCRCKPNWTGDHCDECKIGYGPPGDCSECVTGYHDDNDICCPKYTNNTDGHCKDVTGCLGVRMYLSTGVDYCESLFRDECTEKTPLDTCGYCQYGYLTDDTVPDKPENIACIPDQMVKDAKKVSGARDSLDDVTIILLTIFCTLISVAIGFVVYHKLIKEKKKDPQVKDFYKSAGKRLVEEEPSVSELESGDRATQELVSVGHGGGDDDEPARL